MLRRRLRTLLQPSNFFLLAVGAGCLTDSVTYTRQQDTLAIVAIESHWTIAGGGSLQLCELITTHDEDDTCAVDHVVHSGDNSIPSSHERGGCGGCPLAVQAPVFGSIDLGDGSGPRAVQGVVNLQSGYDDDPYAFPYQLDLSCVDDANPCTIGGTLDGFGGVHVEYYDAPAGQAIRPDVTLDLARVGPAACP